MKERIGESELIINADGTVFHLHLHPEDIGETVILVGDPDRVEGVSKYFDSIELKAHNREFITHTGMLNGKRISALSTGIGTDNIDIVVTELDALCNIDFETRTVKDKHKSLNLIRIGTSGSLQESIPVDTPVVSRMSVGFDGLLNFYADRDAVCNLEAEQLFTQAMSWNRKLAAPYFVDCSDSLFNQYFGGNMVEGINISAPGFYGPQGRVLRLPIVDADINEKISNFSYAGLKISNYEMESSAIYGLSKLLGHQALTICSIIANRMRKEYSADYKKSVDLLIQNILQKV
jgi:uridine phosphorylase